MKRLIPLLIIISITTAGCYYDKETELYGIPSFDCTTVKAAFAADVKPLIQAKCATSGCHNAQGSAGGVVLDTYTQIKAKTDRIYQRCVVQKSMPPGGALSQAEIAVLKCWIDGGAPNN